MARTNRSPSNVAADDIALPRFFGKAGHPDADPNKVKKDGHGKGNWGREGDELMDMEGEFNFHRQRRYSNSTGASMDRTSSYDPHKFEDDDVFEEDHSDDHHSS